MAVMTTWVQYHGTDHDWDKALSQTEHGTYLHSSRWSQHLSNLGWKCCRWQAEDQTALVQGFLKRYPMGIGVLWFPDWIAGDYATGATVLNGLRKSLGLRFIYVRIRSHHILNQPESQLLQQSFTEVKKPFDTAMTMHLSLTCSAELLHQGMSKNWRRNLKRSKRLDYEIVAVDEIDTIVDLYAELSAIKGVSTLFSKEEIASLIEAYRNQIIVIGAKTSDSKIQAIRGAIIHQNQAIDIFAANNALARKYYLSYALCWDLLMQCQQRGCQQFDFNGVDLDNMGVYNFKKGTGAQLVKTLGEFEYASSAMMKYLVNFAAKWRH